MSRLFLILVIFFLNGCKQSDLRIITTATDKWLLKPSEYSNIQPLFDTPVCYLKTDDDEGGFIFEHPANGRELEKELMVDGSLLTTLEGSFVDGDINWLDVKARPAPCEFETNVFKHDDVTWVLDINEEQLLNFYGKPEVVFRDEKTRKQKREPKYQVIIEYLEADLLARIFGIKKLVYDADLAIRFIDGTDIAEISLFDPKEKKFIGKHAFVIVDQHSNPRFRNYVLFRGIFCVEAEETTRDIIAIYSFEGSPATDVYRFDDGCTSHTRDDLLLKIAHQDAEKERHLDRQLYSSEVPPEPKAYLTAMVKETAFLFSSHIDFGLTYFPPSVPEIPILNLDKVFEIDRASDFISKGN